MLDDVIINTQEIRERVVSIGRKLSFVTNLIIGTDEKRYRYLQSNSVEAVLHNCIHKSLKPETAKGKKTIQKSNTNKLCIDLCSSDSEEEWIGNVLVARSKRKQPYHGKSIAQLRAPLLASIELCGDATAPNADSNSSCTVVDIEILEENNNDPNNNLDSIESFQEGANSISALPDGACKMESAKCFSPTPGCSRDFNTANISVRDFARCWGSPTPGCSKDDDTNALSIEEITSPTPGSTNFPDDMYQRDPSECSTTLTQNHGANSDDIAPGLVDEKLQEEAVQICSLLPKFTYQRVYAALCKNSDAENRIELCLWDLLPWKRPTARFPTKRKFVDDNSVGECKKVSPKLSIVEQKEAEFNPCDDEMRVTNDYDLLDGSLQGQDALNIDGSKNETIMVHENYESNEPGKDKVSQSIQKGILQPAKLIINPGTAHAVGVTSSNRSILAPSKLTYMYALQCNDQPGTFSPPMNDKKCKAKRVISNNGAPIAKNVFLAPSTNSPPNGSNNSKEHAFHKYMRYLEFMHDTKREHSSGKPIIYKGKLKHVDIETRKELREAFLRSQFTNSNRITAQLANNKKVPKTISLANTNCDNNVPNDPSKENSAAKSIDMLCDDVAGNEEMNLQMPLTSTKSEGSNPELSDMVTVDLTAATKGAESLPPVASTSTESKGSNDVSPRTASTERAIADGASTRPLIQLAGDREARINQEIEEIHQYEALLAAANWNNWSAAEAPATSGAKPIKLTVNDRSLTAYNIMAGLRPPNVSTVQVGERKVLKGVRRKEINPNGHMILRPDLQKHNDVMAVLRNKDRNRIKSLVLKDSVKTGVASTKPLQESHGFAVEEEKICPVQEAIAQKDDEQYLYLSGIFPDADSTYLRKIVERMNGNQEEIMEFIQSQWENPTYPTKEEKLRRTRITDQQKRYISNFDVKQFLEIFPDPFKHFEDPSRQCKNNANAFTFLKSHFKHHKQTTLKNIYESCNYHLNSAATIVEQVPPDRLSARVTHSWEKCPSEDIPLLQECAFIIHKEEIRKHFEKLKKEEDAKFQRLKKNQELLECQCCYDSECMPSKCSTCNDGHIFCNACIVRGTESKLAQGQTKIPCFVTCDEEFSLSTLQKVLPPTQFSILIGKRQEEEVMAAGLEGLVSCPFCHFASIPPPGDKIFKCLNPACMKESCRLCKELNHIPQKCYEKETDKARLFLEEKMTEALVRKCYKCSRPYFKEDGCNKITCSCGALMCYICDKPVTGYQHFNDGRRGYSHLCPLMSDNNLINNATVEAVAKKTIEYIQQKDPNIKLTAPTVLSQRNLNNNALSDRVSKIAKFDT